MARKNLKLLKLLRGPFVQALNNPTFVRLRCSLARLRFNPVVCDLGAFFLFDKGLLQVLNCGLQFSVSVLCISYFKIGKGGEKSPVSGVGSIPLSFFSSWVFESLSLDMVEVCVFLVFVPGSVVKS